MVVSVVVLLVPRVVEVIAWIAPMSGVEGNTLNRSILGWMIAESPP